MFSIFGLYLSASMMIGVVPIGARIEHGVVHTAPLSLSLK